MLYEELYFVVAMFYFYLYIIISLIPVMVVDFFF